MGEGGNVLCIRRKSKESSKVYMDEEAPECGTYLRKLWKKSREKNKNKSDHRQQKNRWFSSIYLWSVEWVGRCIHKTGGKKRFCPTCQGLEGEVYKIIIYVFSPFQIFRSTGPYSNWEICEVYNNNKKLIYILLGLSHRGQHSRSNITAESTYKREKTMHEKYPKELTSQV